MKLFLKTYNKRITIVLFVAVVLNIAVMRIFDTPLHNDICTNGIVSYELARDVTASEAILNSWDSNARASAGLSLGFDFLFLLIYSSFIAILLYKANNHIGHGRWYNRVHTLFIWMIFVAAFFDVIENIALIRLLLGDLKQIWSLMAFYFATLKFVIIFMCISYLLINWLILLIARGKKV
ncbi:hypothetical protein [Lutimonas sp.]|uniref:hypothetical protein n=1 Tax=Lutimonas sp. TaxID=1872403 RepID=UPI003D9AB5F0